MDQRGGYCENRTYCLQHEMRKRASGVSVRCSVRRRERYGIAACMYAVNHGNLVAAAPFSLCCCFIVVVVAF